MHQRTAMFFAIVSLIAVGAPLAYVGQSFFQTRADYFARPARVEAPVVEEVRPEVYVPPAPVMYPFF